MMPCGLDIPRSRWTVCDDVGSSRNQEGHKLHAITEEALLAHVRIDGRIGILILVKIQCENGEYGSNDNGRWPGLQPT